ncbi:MAG: diaminopropionate ammonia-lyase [Candidatus Aminicenantes bacterium]|nr:diaminopropionate ammonia-lyase [Candidatus Aminicenantes bacterium]
MCKYSFNSERKAVPSWDGKEFHFLKNNDMIDFHRSLSGYKPTPFIELTNTSNDLGTGEILAKDESGRFGIKAFKALGASYAIFRVLKKIWEEKYSTGFDFQSFRDEEKLDKLGKFTFCAASDGNHGRAVAWTSKMLGHNSVIFMPSETVSSRIKNIESESGKVVIIDGTYDDCVRVASEEAAKNGWYEIADTAYPGYTDIPSWVLNGYSTLFREMEEKVSEYNIGKNDFIFLQAGAGAFAASGASWLIKQLGSDRPKIVIVEPLEASCYLESIIEGKAVATKGKMETIMAGLNCGVPSIIAWPILKDTADLFITISDDYAKEAMRRYASEGITSGESGASGLAGLIALMTDKTLEQAKSKIGIGKNSKIIVVNTEGDTDPENYKKIIGSK